MKVNLKNIAEIAGGLVIGTLVFEAVGGTFELAKNVVGKLKEKKEEKEES